MGKNKSSQSLSHEYTKEMVEELYKCSLDPIYFSEGYVQIIHPDPEIGKHTVKLRTYQKDLMRVMTERDRVIIKMPRQSGKSAAVCLYLFWYVMFNKDVTVAMLAHKDSAATSLLTDVKVMYDFVPSWLKPNYIEYNAHTLSLDNGSKIFSAATSTDALVGESITILYLDEFALVKPEIAEQFYAYNSATVTEGKQVIISSTPRGVGNLFHKFWEGAIEERNAFKSFETKWWNVPDKDEKWKEDKIQEIGPVMFASEYECSFIGSQTTVVSSRVLQDLKPKPALYEEKILNGIYKKWKEFDSSKHYLASLDLGLGTGADYSVLMIFSLDIRKPTIQEMEEFERKDIDIPEFLINQIEQVAVFKTNTDNLTNFANQSIEILSEWGCPFMIFEHNGIGMSLAERLMHGDLYYENVYVHDNGKYGIMSGPATKIRMIGYLKKHMELNHFLLHDKDTISEMLSYVEYNSTSGNKKFEADVGHDDHVVCVGWVCYLLETNWLIDALTFK